MSVNLKREIGRFFYFLFHPQAAMQALQLEADYWFFKKKYSFFLNGSEPSRPSNKKLLVANLGGGGTLGNLKTEAMLAKAIELQGYTPIILTLNEAKRNIKYFRMFGFSHFEFFDRDIDSAAQKVSKENSRLLLHSFSYKEIKELRYRDVYIGRHVLSTLAANRREGRLELSEPTSKESLLNYIYQAMTFVLAAESLLDRLQPQIVLLGEKGYMGFAEIYDIALNRGINTITWNSAHREDALIFKRFIPQTRHQHYFSLSSETWKEVATMSWGNEKERELTEEIEMHYKKGYRFQGEPLQMGKAMKSKQQIQSQLRLDCHKKTAIVFSHVLWDGTISYGDNLFDDYEKWLIETVKAACANPAVNWIVKFHPANVWKAKQMNYRGKLWDQEALDRALGILPPHIKLLSPDTNINTFSLFDLADYAVTVRGTVGIEMPCFGIRVFTAGNGRYSELGFTEDSKTREEYLAKLRRIQIFPRLNVQQVELAKRHAYALFILRPWLFTTFRLRYASYKRANHQLNPNLIIQVSSSQNLLNAKDLKIFSEWVVNSKELDFLSRTPFSEKILY